MFEIRVNNDPFVVGKIIEVNGVKWVNSEFWGQGHIYKNYQAFENKTDEVCYISEYGFPQEENPKTMIIDEDTYYLLSDCESFTYKDFIKLVTEDFLPKEEIEKRASILFDMVDWQFPSSLYYELEFEELESEEE